MPMLAVDVDDETMDRLRVISRCNEIDVSEVVLSLMRVGMEDVDWSLYEGSGPCKRGWGYYYTAEEGLAFNGKPVGAGVATMS